MGLQTPKNPHTILARGQTGFLSTFYSVFPAKLCHILNCIFSFIMSNKHVWVGVWVSPSFSRVKSIKMKSIHVVILHRAILNEYNSAQENRVLTCWMNRIIKATWTGSCKPHEHFEMNEMTLPSRHRLLGFMRKLGKNMCFFETWMPERGGRVSSQDVNITCFTWLRCERVPCRTIS